MTVAIQKLTSERGITRICHFSPSRNLLHIARGEAGILATKTLKDDERNLFNATDTQRFDGHEDHICCSIQYPNGWYFSKVRKDEPLFLDWVVFLIKPDYLWKPGTLFCQRNAAAGRGRFAFEGVDGFQAMFKPQVTGAGGREYQRKVRHLACSPTDDQAEVLVPGQIVQEDILAIAVKDVEQAKMEIQRLEIAGVPVTFNFLIAPDLFEKTALSDAIRSGIRPSETLFRTGS
jgi:hypothetical protein